MSVFKEAIGNVTGGVNAPLECWECNNSPRYHAYRFHTCSKFPQKIDPNVAKCANQSIKEYAQLNSL